MHIKKGIKFLLHKRAAGQTTNLAIRMRVTLHGERPLDFPLRQNVDAAGLECRHHARVAIVSGVR